jgi:hypothetical protein
VPWSVVDAAEPDVVSFDLVRFGLPSTARRPLRRVIARGGRVMWGAIDPLAPDDARAARRRVAAAAFGLGARPTDGLVSPSCGTGQLSVGQESALARLVADVAGRPRTGPAPRPVIRTA